LQKILQVGCVIHVVTFGHMDVDTIDTICSHKKCT
jgi:hypothetical protein